MRDNFVTSMERLLISLLLLHQSVYSDITVVSKDKSTTITVSSANGHVYQIGGNTTSGGVDVDSFTRLQGCAYVQGTRTVTPIVTPNGTAAHVYQHMKCATSTVIVQDTYSPDEHSVLWATSIGSDSTADEPFTTPIYTETYWNPSHWFLSHSKLWLPWGKGCLRNNDDKFGICYSYQRDWSPGLTPEPFPPTNETRYRLGEVLKSEDTPYFLGVDDLMTIPMVHVLPSGDTVDFERSTQVGGVTIGLSVDEYLPDVVLHTTYNRTSFSRHFLRIGIGPMSVQFSQYIKSHQDTDFRSGLSFMAKKFPFVLGKPHNEQIREMEGLGSYTWWLGPWETNKTVLDSYGYKINWELSGMWMPYDGLFLPYQPEWENLGPIDHGLKQYNVTYEKITEFHNQVQNVGYHSLSYFMIGGYGTRIDVPPKQPPPYNYCGTVDHKNFKSPAPCPTPVGGNEYLWEYLMGSALDSAWHPLYGFLHGVRHDWVGSILMDPAGNAWEKLLLDQADYHLTKLPLFEGIAIDRLDYTDYYNYNFDDGVSWVPYPPPSSSSNSSSDPQGGMNELNANLPYGPASSLRVSYNAFFEKLHQMYHVQNNKVMLMNCNTLCRVDLLKYFDGTFSEGSVLNAVGWSGLNRPTILWTYSLNKHTNDQLHHAFQAHVLMKVYPMAPTPYNDHSIQPRNSTVNQYYALYGGMFDALHGSNWNLDTPHSIVILSPKNSALQYNSFLSPPSVAGQPDALLFPLVMAAAHTSVHVQINHPPGLGEAGTGSYDCKQLYPDGSRVWKPVATVPVKQFVGTLTVDLGSAGATIVRCSLIAAG